MGLKKILGWLFKRQFQGRNKDVDVENGLDDTGWEGEAGVK